MAGRSTLALFFISCFLPHLALARNVVTSNRILRHDSSCRGGVSYPGLGCFTLQPPFTNTRWLPQSPSYVGTAFLLYTRQNRLEADILVADQRSSIELSHFDAQNPTKILVHGFLQNRFKDFLVNMTRELLENDAMNVIVVGWSGGAGFPYGQAVANTRLVGAQIAQLVTALRTQTGLSLNQVHIIGHSLGAQVAGYAGARLPGLARITGLDPAQPNYHNFDPAVRLDITDADLVDVIHTDALPYDTVHGYGIVEPVGHMDFYPNGGHSQPGCHEDDSIMDFFEDALSRGISSAESGLSCSHERSTTLFIASINPQDSCTFMSFPCSSSEQFAWGECTSCGNNPCPVMGYHASTSFSRSGGVFYLNTTSAPPFCGHHHLVTLTLDSEMDYAIGTLEVNLVGVRGESGWTEIKTGELNAGDEGTKVVLSQNLIGDIINMDVKFTKKAGYFSWSTDRVELQRAKVTSPLQGHPKYFCQLAMTLRDRQPLTLAEGSYIQADC